MCPGPVAFSVFLSFLGGIWSLKLRTRHLCAFIYASHFNKAPGERCWLWFTYYYFYLVHMIHIYTTVEHKESLIETINKNWNVKKSIHIHVGVFSFSKPQGASRDGGYMQLWSLRFLTIVHTGLMQLQWVSALMVFPVSAP